MAQDFGDDMGNALLNFVTRQTENYLRFGRGRERAFDWWQRHYKKEGNTPEAAKAMAEKQSSREQVVVPFGTSEEAAYYAQVCRENGTYAAAYMDKQGNGFLAFAKEDAKTVAGYAPQFKDVMARLDEQRITDALNHAEPVDKKTMDSLTELTGYPDLPAEDVTVIPVTIRYKDAPDETYDMSQLESKYDKKAQTIIDCCDSTLFLGGKSNSTNKEIAEMIGKQTIHQMTYNESTGQSSSASKNLQIQGRDLIDAAEIGKMSRLKAILLIAGTNPLMDDKYDPHAHKRYRYIVDKRNWKRLHKNSFDFERYLKNGCEPYTPDEDMGAEFTAWKWAAWKRSRKGLLGKLLNR